MNIKNIALVRATNIIPFDGIVHPISNTPYLYKAIGTGYSFIINDLLRKEHKLKEVDWSNPSTLESITHENTAILKQYLPYMSDYNSMVLWSLNGLVPDDINNTFSNKTCAIIDGLEEHIADSEFISLVPTDTAIKGDVPLSKQASILVSKDRYDSLSSEEKEKLSNLDLKIVVFEGAIKDAIDENLTSSNRFPAETLSLTRSDRGYLNSDTSDELISTIDDVAEKMGIAQVLHFDVLTGRNDEQSKLLSVKDELSNSFLVGEFYRNTFIEYLSHELGIDDDLKNDLINFPNSSEHLKTLGEKISEIGLEKYKNIIDIYNDSLERLRLNGKLPTPQNIVDSVKDGKPTIDLLSELRNLENSNILESAISATTTSIRSSKILEQASSIANKAHEKGKKTDIDDVRDVD